MERILSISVIENGFLVVTSITDGDKYESISTYAKNQAQLVKAVKHFFHKELEAKIPF